jgi:hypothetical protein
MPPSRGLAPLLRRRRLLALSLWRVHQIRAPMVKAIPIQKGDPTRLLEQFLRQTAVTRGAHLPFRRRQAAKDVAGGLRRVLHAPPV